MEAKDLMIGDWVYSSFSKKPCRVTGLKVFDETYGSVIVDKVNGVKDILSLSPIPLTVEILERNGFVRNVWYIYTAPACCLSVEQVRGYFFLRLGTLQLCEIKYVHELQNFLRDFKTNKEITL